MTFWLENPSLVSYVTLWSITLLGWSIDGVFCLSQLWASLRRGHRAKILQQPRKKEEAEGEKNR